MPSFYNFENSRSCPIQKSLIIRDFERVIGTVKNSSCIFTAPNKQKNNRVCKPGSVLSDHQSVRHVTMTLERKVISYAALPPADICRANDPLAVLLRIGFTFAALLPKRR